MGARRRFGRVLSLFSARRQGNFGRWIFILVAVSATIALLFFKLRQPLPSPVQKVVFNRAADNYVDIAWISTDPSIGVVVWGLAPDKLDRPVLDRRGLERSKLHAVSLAAETDSAIFFAFLINDQLVLSEDNLPWRVEPISQKYELIPLPTEPTTIEVP